MANDRSKKGKQPTTANVIKRDGPNWPLFGLALLGMALSGYLTFTAWQGSRVAFCTEGAGCDALSDLAGGEFVEASSCHYPLAALPAAAPAILPKTEPAVRPVPPG